MKVALIRGRSARRDSITKRASMFAQREWLPLNELTGCLLDVYDDVASRAYKKYLDRGAAEGGELDDWVAAERELLQPLPIDFENEGKYIHALAAVQGLTAQQISVGIEANWLLIRTRGGEDVSTQGSSEMDHLFSADTRLASAEAGEIHRAAKSAGEGAKRRAAASDLAERQRYAPADGGRGTERGRAGRRTGISRGSSVFARAAERLDMFSLHELTAEVDPSRSVAILSNGVLGIRMPKVGV